MILRLIDDSRAWCSYLDLGEQPTDKNYFLVWNKCVACKRCHWQAAVNQLSISFHWMTTNKFVGVPGGVLFSSQIDVNEMKYFYSQYFIMWNFKLPAFIITKHYQNRSHELRERCFSNPKLIILIFFQFLKILKSSEIIPL